MKIVFSSFSLLLSMNFIKVFCFLICFFILFLNKEVAGRIKCKADYQEILSIFTAATHKIGKRNSFEQIMERSNKVVMELKIKNMANKLCSEVATYCFRYKLSRYTSVEAGDIKYFTIPDFETDYAAITEQKLYLRHTAFVQCHFQQIDISHYFFISTYDETGYPWFVFTNGANKDNPEVGILIGILTK